MTLDQVPALDCDAGMTSLGVHQVFDLIAACVAAAATWLAYSTRLKSGSAFDLDKLGPGYAAALVAGAAVGGFGFGTINLTLSGIDGFGRSVVGALAGAIAGVELFKNRRGIQGSTGVIFVPGFCTTLVLGRIGCFLSGLEDHTHGIATALPWGHDYGDGILRHPVQLYEAACMGLFLAWAAIAIARRNHFFLANGFYVMVAVYAAQRFVWEFLKPYATLLGPFNLFHFVCVALLLYTAHMIRERRNAAA